MAEHETVTYINQPDEPFYTFETKRGDTKGVIGFTCRVETHKKAEGLTEIAQLTQQMMKIAVEPVEEPKK